MSRDHVLDASEAPLTERVAARELDDEGLLGAEDRLIDLDVGIGTGVGAACGHAAKLRGEEVARPHAQHRTSTRFDRTRDAEQGAAGERIHGAAGSPIVIRAAGTNAEILPTHDRGAQYDPDNIAIWKPHGEDVQVVVAPRTVEVRPADGGPLRRIRGDKLFVNLGAEPALLVLPGLAAAEPLTSRSALELDRLPEHLVIMGGGYIGVELGQAFRRFGSRVTSVQRGPHLLPAEDVDISEAVEAIFREEGIVLALGSQRRASRAARAITRV